MSHAIVIILTSLFWSLLFYHTTHTRHWGSSTYKYVPGAARHNITTNAHFVSCGNSTTEALHAGCNYSLLHNAWVPPVCDAPDFNAEYLDDGSWGAFEDENMTVPLKAEELGFREVYYTSAKDHANHCGMMWKLQFWALFEEWGALDSIIARPGHTDHCAQFLMDIDAERHVTRVEVEFAGCWVRNWK